MCNNTKAFPTDMRVFWWEICPYISKMGTEISLTFIQNSWSWKRRKISCVQSPFSISSCCNFPPVCLSNTLDSSFQPFLTFDISSNSEEHFGFFSIRISFFWNQSYKTLPRGTMDPEIDSIAWSYLINCKFVHMQLWKVAGGRKKTERVWSFTKTPSDPPWFGLFYGKKNYPLFVWKLNL